MKKTFDDNIFLCSNRQDRKIPVHGVSGTHYTDDNGFTIFELDQTMRDFSNRHVSIDVGHFLLTDENCYKISAISVSEKRPKKVTCTTVLTDKKEIPHYNKFNFKKGTYQEKKSRRTA